MSQKMPVKNRDIEDLKPVCKKMIAERTSVVVSCRGLGFSFATYILSQADRTLQIKNTVPLDFIHEVVYQRGFQLAFPETNFHTSHLGGNGVDFLFMIEEVQNVQSLRRHQRKDYSTKKAYVEYRNPYDQKTLFAKKIITLSEGGMSFETLYPSLLLYPGQQFAQGKITVDGKVVKEAGFRIVYCKKYFDVFSQAKYLVGAAFQDV